MPALKQEGFVSKPAAKDAASSAPDIDAEVELALMICGDARAALKATLIANGYLEEELERVREMQSAGYGRGRIRRIPKRKIK